MPTFTPPTIRFGGDYNPDQWPRDVWDDDVRLMNRASVTTVSLPIFSWAKLEPEPGVFNFGWLDDVFATMEAGSIRIDLATATASPPPWMATLFPDTLPVDINGVRLGVGSRQQYSPSSSTFRKLAIRLVRQLADRYGSHPAVESWHISNEYGCHVPMSYDAESVEAFRAWLKNKYATIDALNDAWGTAFWSQAYGDFDQVGAPAAMPTFPNPTQLIDWERFSSDALLGLFLAEKAVIREITPDIPITTNFMGFFRDADYWQWAPHMDYVSDDLYPDPADSDHYIMAAATRDLMRSLGGGRPWILMEQSTSAVNWRPRNAPKPAGMNRAHSLQAVARGADGILYFQWRQAKAGAEKFHASMVPHGGEDTRIFREVTALGSELAAISPNVIGRKVPARVGIVFDWDSWRSLDQEAQPTRIDYVATVLSWYRPLLRRGITVDFVQADGNLSGYDLVIAPVVQVASEAALQGWAQFVAGGGTLLATYQSGILNENLHAYLGGYLGPLRSTMGIRIEEFAPLAAPYDQRHPDPAASTRFPVPGTRIEGQLAGEAGLWQEIVLADDADVVARFADGFAAGQPAVTRRAAGDGGAAWYVATQPSNDLIDSIMARLLDDAGVTTGLFDEPTDQAEAVRRGDMLFVINHADHERDLMVAGQARRLPAYGVEVSALSAGA
ncbi:MAG: beta-galactosidase [Cellulomonadaceae bacterium]|nr:beta-galactosidase [Cellulomonadaceae bacterium]